MRAGAGHVKGLVARPASGCPGDVKKGPPAEAVSPSYPTPPIPPPHPTRPLPPGRGPTSC
jgi:hypothetical protein